MRTCSDLVLCLLLLNGPTYPLQSCGGVPFCLSFCLSVCFHSTIQITYEYLTRCCIWVPTRHIPLGKFTSPGRFVNASVLNNLITYFELAAKKLRIEF